jgi:hypothetical protein
MDYFGEDFSGEMIRHAANSLVSYVARIIAAMFAFSDQTEPTRFGLSRIC